MEKRVVAASLHSFVSLSPCAPVASSSALPLCAPCASAPGPCTRPCVGDWCRLSACACALFRSHLRPPSPCARACSASLRSFLSARCADTPWGDTPCLSLFNVCPVAAPPQRAHPRSPAAAHPHHQRPVSRRAGADPGQGREHGGPLRQLACPLPPPTPGLKGTGGSGALAERGVGGGGIWRCGAPVSPWTMRPRPMAAWGAGAAALVRAQPRLARLVLGIGCTENPRPFVCNARGVR